MDVLRQEKEMREEEVKVLKSRIDELVRLQTFNLNNSGKEHKTPKTPNTVEKLARIAKYPPHIAIRTCLLLICSFITVEIWNCR